MRRISCLLLLIAACDGNTSNNNDMTMPDLAGDGGGCVEGAKCLTTAGGKGICHAGACGCADPGDDTACDTAYSEPNKHYICSSGTCVIGCRTANDCNGQLCGLSIPNTCGPCSTDAQCTMALGGGHICNTTSGECVTSDCTVPNAACANSLDICCTMGGSNSCVAGNCCSSSDCMGGETCVNHTCTSCPSPSPGMLAVDPSDTGTAPTGADVAGCRYKTITAAMNVITGPGTIKVLGSKTITGSGSPCADTTIECFPIAVKANVSVVGDSAMPPTINVAAGKNGFALSAAGSGLSNLTLDGSDNTMAAAAKVGIDIQPAATPSPSPAPTLDHVTVKTFLNGGIQVSGGTVVINPGVVSTGNDNGLALLVSGAKATINGGADQISFSSNMTAGINVTNGALTATGTPGTSGAGNLICNQNPVGIAINEPAGTGAATTVNLNGVVAWKNTVSGITIVAGTPVKIRNSYVLGNTQMGVDVQASAAAPTEIDIGTGTNYGHNTVQYAADNTMKNGGAGICNRTNGTVNMTGNIYGTIDCSVVTTSINVTGACTGAADIGNSGGGNTNHGMCGPP